MKAKIKSTGETVNVYEDINGDFVTEHGSLYRSWQLEFENRIDWEQRRYEIAKELMKAFANNAHNQCVDATTEMLAQWSVSGADKLISELQKKKTVIGRQVEHKEVHLGDIIEVNGEKYICKEAHEDQDCSCCDLCVDDDCKRPYGNCSSDYREDRKDLLFKKIGGEK